MKRLFLFSYRPVVIVSLLTLMMFGPLHGQKNMDGIERDRMKSMLKNIKSLIKKDYYDPNFHGIDLDVRFKKAEDRLDQVATTGQAIAVIAQVLVDFNDSHLYFVPPATNLDIEYGWRLRMFGDKCFVTIVKPKSDAEAKGLKPGDQILAIENFPPSRKELWKMMYYFNTVSKRNSLKMTVLSPGSQERRELEIKAKIKQRPSVITREIFYSLFDTSGKTDIDYNYLVRTGNIAIWKMPSFSIEPDVVGMMMGKIAPAQHLILDLRGNGGGFVVTMEALVGQIFDKDLTIAELKGRKKLDSPKSKSRGNGAFKGKLVVLIDHNSASASEMFARLVQLEKRGIVIGDVSAGGVMQSRLEVLSLGANDEVVFGVNVTNADVIMSDGKSLEHTGVTPDELLIPSGADLAAQRDPVLARAIELLGGSVSPEAAGKYFVYKWKENDVIAIEIQK